WESERLGLLLPLLASLLLRHFLAFAARLGKADRDRLLAARHLPATASALERAAFTLVHGAFHLLRRAFRIFAGHRPFSDKRQHERNDSHGSKVPLSLPVRAGRNKPIRAAFRSIGRTRLRASAPAPYQSDRSSSCDLRNATCAIRAGA